MAFLVHSMGELFDECAVLATDKTDEEVIKKIKEALTEPKQWKGIYALPLPGTETAGTFTAV